jgi:RNA polymerase sigma factor (sigma-70 family)
MSISQMSEVLQHLRQTVLPREGAGRTDGQLLEDFISRREEAALAALVRRHGPMVWGVCRRVLRNYHDAEDAFQATFLVLVRKSASVVPREMVANWLYGVAYQTALKAQATTATRRARERQVIDMTDPEVVEQDPDHDLRPLLDQELSRLPGKYRAVILLCDLEGKTRKEAARQLDLPEGTVAGRLARARVMLAKRLVGQGLAVSGGALAGVLSHSAAVACVPASVVTSTIKAASLLAGGQAAVAGVISAPVAALTEGVLQTMLMTKLKIGAGLFVLVGLAVATAASLAQGVLAPGPAATTRNVGTVAQPDKLATQPDLGKVNTEVLREGAAETTRTVLKGAPPDEPAAPPKLKKAKWGRLADFKKIDTKQNTITCAFYTSKGRKGEDDIPAKGDTDLTHPLTKGVKVFVEVKKGKKRTEIKLQDLKPGTRIHVYFNEEPDGSTGRNVMEIVVLKDK